MAAVAEKRLDINTFVAKGLVAQLSAASNETRELYESDVNIAYRLLIEVLRYETLQSGLNLTHTQDRNFIQVCGMV